MNQANAAGVGRQASRSLSRVCHVSKTPITVSAQVEANRARIDPIRGALLSVSRRFSPDPVSHTSEPSPGGVQRYFESSLLLMLGTGFLTLATTGKLDFISVAVVSLALLIRLGGQIREMDFMLGASTVNRLAVGYLVFFGLDLLLFSPGPGLTDRMLSATVHLVLFATVVKVFSARTYRDYAYLVTLSFLMMMAAAILTVSSTYLFGLTLYVLFSISTFISYEMKRSGEAGGGRAQDSGYGLRSSGTGVRHSVDPSSPGSGRETGISNRESRVHRTALERALIKTTLGLAAGIALLASALFFAIPRYRTGYLSLGSTAEKITGFSEKVDLGDIRKIKRSSLVVMRVMTSGNTKQFQGVKWRGVGLTSFDGKHWYNDNTGRVPIEPDSAQRFVLHPSKSEEGRRGPPLRYRVLLSPVSTDVLFAAAVPQEIDGHLSLIAVDETFSLHSPQAGYKSVEYDAVSETGVPSAAELRRASAEYPPEIRLIYLRLPQLDPAVADLARRVTASASNNYDRSLALQNYLRGSFGYALDPRGIDRSDPVSSFLFKAKEGYCAYFAAAMALMLRTLDIPSRLVNGFQTGSYNRVGKDFIVRARDAHSWVEVYFPGYGWVAFDPTPPDPDAEAVEASGPLDEYLDGLTLFWDEWIVNYDFAHQVRLAREFEQDSREYQEKARIRFERFQGRGAQLAYAIEAWLVRHKTLVFCLVLAALACLSAADWMLRDPAESFARLRLWWRWRFQHLGAELSPRDATLAYEGLLKVLQKKGLTKSPSLTPQEFAHDLATSSPGRVRLGASVAEFTELYNAIRFGRRPVPLTQLRRILDDIRGSRA